MPVPAQPPFGARLRRLRRLRGMKQAHLAELAGVDQTTVSRWERGALLPDPGRAAELLRLVGVEGTPALDRALARLVRQSTAAVHLICDGEHRLLAASSLREQQWRVPAADLRGVALRRFATLEIEAAEQQLPALGWQDGAVDSVLIWPGDGRNGLLPIMPTMMLWERLPLSDGSMVRLCTDFPHLPTTPGLHRPPAALVNA